MLPIDALVGKRGESALLVGSALRLRRFLNYCSVILYFCGFWGMHRRAHCLLRWERRERGDRLLRGWLDCLVAEELFDWLLGRIEGVERLSCNGVGLMIGRAESILRTEEFPDFPGLLRALRGFHLLMTFSHLRSRVLGGLEGRHKLLLQRFFEAAPDDLFIIPIFEGVGRWGCGLSILFG